MSEQAISQQEIDAVFPKVAQVIADALGGDVEDVKPKVPLIEGLDAESIDFLDLVFRLERGFGVKIPRGKIVEDALNKAVAENPQAAQYSRGVHNAILVAIPGMIGTALAYWRIRAQEEAEDAA